MPKPPSRKDEKFSEDEAERRLIVALRGSRIAGHKPMTDIPKKKNVKIAKRKAVKKRARTTRAE